MILGASPFADQVLLVFVFGVNLSRLAALMPCFPSCVTVFDDLSSGLES
jgi:hypothetical protein